MAEKNQLRKVAEAALDKMPQPRSEGTSEAAELQVHELRVHQIELEMQNEELRRAQFALEESQTRYFELYDLAPVGYLTLSDEGGILQANLTAAGLLGVLRSRLINRRITKFIVEKDWPVYFRHRNELLGTAAAATCELRIGKPDGSFFWAQMTSNVIRQMNDVPAFRVTLSDITAIKRQADKLQEYHHLLSGIVDNSPSSIFAFDLQHRIILLNDAMGRFLGLPKEEAMGKFITDILPGELAAALMVTNSGIMASGEPQRIEEVIRSRARNDPRTLITTKFALRNARGEITGLGGVVSDVTDYENALDDLRKSLDEKDSLLKEIHHRVKNNLQIVSSLLRLQASRVASPDTQSVLMDMEGRIHSMALVHEHLYLSENLAAVDLATYLRQLCNHLYHSLILIPGTVQLHLDISHVVLPIDQAIPCGLLVNELVSNAFKHAFPGGRAGQLWVCLKSLADGQGWLLRVADDGVGLPPDLDLGQLSSLGLKLVSDLSRQLSAKVTLGSGPGAVLEVLCVPPAPADFPSSRK